MVGGRMVHQGTAAELSDEGLLRYFFLGDDTGLALASEERET